MQAINFLKGVVLKLIPRLGYKGIADTQIQIYKKLKEENLKALRDWSKNNPSVGFIAPYQEQDILNVILDTRRRVSLKDIGADFYYKDLITIKNKTLEETIWAIIDWELFSNMRAYERRGKNNIPLEFIDGYKKEIKDYIRKRIVKVL